MTINSTTRKTNNLVGNGNTATYPFAFKVFTDADVVVKKLEVSTSIETTLTLGANNDYIVTLNDDQNSNPGGSITLKSGGNNQNLASGFQLVITSAVQPLQGTDLTNQGGFFPEVINDALDKAIVLHQQQQDELDRSIKFSLTNTIGSLEITENANARKNRVLGFDNLGEFEVLKELGTYRGNWAASTAYAVRDLVKDTSTNNIFFCNTAHTSSGSQPLTTNTNSANWDLIVDAASATTASNNAASSATASANSATAAANSATAAATSETNAAASATTATTKATQADTAKTAAETAKTAAETAKTAAETALDSFDDRYLGAKSSNPTLDNDGNALIDGALYFNTTVNRMRVYDLGNTTWLEVTISGSDLTNTNTVAGAISNVNAVGSNISNVNAVASNSSNINAVSSNSSNINTVAGAASAINTVSGSISNVNTVSGGIANVNTVAAEINNNKLQTVANNINAVVTAANDLNEATSEIDTVANAITNVDNVGNNIANVNTVAGALSNINAVAGNASNINTVGGAITNVNNVGGSIANVNTVASNLSGVNAFAARYRVGTTNPTTDLDNGDLFYNTNLGKLLVYNATTSAWEETQTIGNFFINTISQFSGTGGNSATFNGAAYKFTLSNAGQFAQQMLVSINGVVQKPNSGTGQPSEGFALDGSEIVFSSAPPTGADFFIVTIGATVSIGTPSNGTVTPASFANGTSGNNGKFLRANNGAAPSFETVNTDLVSDTSPQLGGDLDTNGNDIDFADNVKATFGASEDLLIKHSGTNSEIYHNGEGHFYISAQGSSEMLLLSAAADIRLSNSVSGDMYLKAISDGAVELYHNGGKKFASHSNGLAIKNEAGGADSSLYLIGAEGRNAEFQMNADDGDDNPDYYRLIHFASDNSWRVQNYHAGSWGDNIKAINGGGVELYHDNVKKFETQSSGTRFAAGSAVFNGPSGTAYTVEVRPFNANPYGFAVIENSNANAGYPLLGVTSNNGQTYFRTLSGGQSEARNILPVANNTYDLGSSTRRWQNIFTNDLNLSNEGGANDVDGTWGSYTIQEGAEDLFLVNKRNGKKYKFNLTEVS